MTTESLQMLPSIGAAFWNLPREVVQPRYEFLIRLFLDYFGEEPFSMLEIGVHEGALLKSLMDSDLNITSYDGVDPYLGRDEDYYLGSYWKSREEADELYRKVEQVFGSHGHELHRCTSGEFFNVSSGKTWDLIYIDGDHSLKSCLWDITHWFNRTASSGLMVVDDYANVDHPGVTKAVNQFIRTHREDIAQMGYRSYEMYSGDETKPVPVSKANVFFKRRESAITGELETGV